MADKKQIIIGSYTTPKKVEDAVEELKQQGYSKEDISLYVNQTIAQDYKELGGVSVKTSLDDGVLSSVAADFNQDKAVVTVEDYSGETKDSSTFPKVNLEKEQVNKGYNKEPIDYGVDADPTGRSLGTEQERPEEHQTVDPNSPFTNE